MDPAGSTRPNLQTGLATNIVPGKSFTAVSKDGEEIVYQPVGEPIDMSKHHSARTKDRKQALDILFEADLRNVDVDEVLAGFSANPETKLRAYASDIVVGVSVHQETIEQRIQSCLTKGWTLTRMPRIDRCLAKICAWEIDYNDTPNPVAISEAIGLAEELSTSESTGFLAGLLNKVSSTSQK